MRLSVDAIRAAGVTAFGFSGSGCQITGGKLVMSTDRDANGRFLRGHPGMGGRPRRAVEQDYLATLAEAVPLRRWKKIVARAAADAEAGDPKARRWLGDMLMGKQPPPLTTLAATELAGTLDEEIRVQAAALRWSVKIRKMRYRAFPDLNPDRSDGRGTVEEGPPDHHTDHEARRPGRSGRPGSRS
jgi:hypothetical protein